MEREPACLESWVLNVAICVVVWASFCLGMWVGQVQTLAVIESAKKIEADREP